MDENDILEHAKDLGKQLAGHPKVTAYRDTQQRLQGDEQAKRLLRDYQLLAEKLQKAQAEGRKITDQDAAQLQKLEQDLAANDAVKAWMRAQSDYVDLMYRVDRTVQQGLAEAMGRVASRQPPPRPGPAQPLVPKIVPHPG
jgi:cell fate (sporulation/competence/biofilm development) regulator YlbF (YheA/YmcA/DUF963 family)